MCISVGWQIHMHCKYSHVYRWCILFVCIINVKWGKMAIKSDSSNIHIVERVLEPIIYTCILGGTVLFCIFFISFFSLSLCHFSATVGMCACVCVYGMQWFSTISIFMYVMEIDNPLIFHSHTHVMMLCININMCVTSTHILFILQACISVSKYIKNCMNSTHIHFMS